MDLEERSIEQLPDRCQSCGARLTDAEKQAALEGSAGAAVLCTICASEQVPVTEDEAEEPEAGY
jgi:hypothetical protein